MLKCIEGIFKKRKKKNKDQRFQRSVTTFGVRTLISAGSETATIQFLSISFKKGFIAISLKSTNFYYHVVFLQTSGVMKQDTQQQLFTEHTLNQLQNIKMLPVTTLSCKQLSINRFKLVLKSNFTGFGSSQTCRQRKNT